MSVVIKSLHLYGIIVIVSVLIGMLYIYLMLKDDIKKNKNILLFYLIYMIFAFIFGKLYTMFAYGNDSFFNSGLSAYGGLIGVVIGAIVFEKIIDMNGKLILNSILSLPLVYGISKIACFTSGCCSGIPYDGLFNVIYPEVLNIKQFPIQILESIIFLIVFVICHKLRNKKYISYVSLLIASVLKFSLDFLRYDHFNEFYISPNQWFSVILFLIVFIVLLRKICSKKRD